jgi:hypothetical protein
VLATSFGEGAPDAGWTYDEDLGLRFALRKA